MYRKRHGIAAACGWDDLHSPKKDADELAGVKLLKRAAWLDAARFSFYAKRDGF